MSQAMITMIPSVRSARPASGPFTRMASSAASFLSGLRREWQLRQDRRVLQDLDDRALADIGIGRSQVETAIRHGRSDVAGTAARPGRRDPGPLMPASWTEWR
ncbi:DUF1127 domain-containing protein [uncultured Enterovirga sp.]|uniref:DUF1127 domain-containing protein n=1 Tax=uncultured Enterovirga sp. TaxID=2026352 RepID=UPI0035CB6B17